MNFEHGVRRLLDLIEAEIPHVRNTLTALLPIESLPPTLALPFSAPNCYSEELVLFVLVSSLHGSDFHANTARQHWQTVWTWLATRFRTTPIRPAAFATLWNIVWTITVAGDPVFRTDIAEFLVDNVVHPGAYPIVVRDLLRWLLERVAPVDLYSASQGPDKPADPSLLSDSIRRLLDYCAQLLYNDLGMRDLEIRQSARGLLRKAGCLPHLETCNNPMALQKRSWFNQMMAILRSPSSTAANVIATELVDFFLSIHSPEEIFPIFLRITDTSEVSQKWTICLANWLARMQSFPGSMEVDGGFRQLMDNSTPMGEFDDTSLPTALAELCHLLPIAPIEYTHYLLYGLVRLASHSIDASRERPSPDTAIGPIWTSAIQLLLDYITALGTHPMFNIPDDNRPYLLLMGVYVLTSLVSHRRLDSTLLDPSVHSVATPSLVRAPPSFEEYQLYLRSWSAIHTLLTDRFPHTPRLGPGEYSSIPPPDLTLGRVVDNPSVVPVVDSAVAGFWALALWDYHLLRLVMSMPSSVFTCPLHQFSIQQWAHLTWPRIYRSPAPALTTGDRRTGLSGLRDSVSSQCDSTDFSYAPMSFLEARCDGLVFKK
ncbi:hypothetical protein BJ085DRAFT_36537 [Dimargaris cristalligena]|uniref:Uncharacterized protein n=1 Tax=Dimargaris cristalligena TaxID=215637 RepID=A0A4P9ZQW5_9FUNG|nr:hypothetical protein BJ085DRAFT_36537 [Dimargaris cristalligena]|eukprot:RKP35715.1 hypothetical protein BJ085DRAFT_36537 [Dimargaris cristalligena]